MKSRLRQIPSVRQKFLLQYTVMAVSVAAVFSTVLIILFQTGPIQTATAGSGTAIIPSGSFIINTGITPQTIANGLKPYGMIYDLMVNYNVPVIWSINPSKSKDENDFVISGTGYRGGPFIIAAPFITPTVASRITHWQSQGVIGVYTTSDNTIPVYDTLTSFPQIMIDNLSGNQGIVISYFNNADIPPSAYSIGTPATLSTCHDMWVNPHGDPTWATHSYLYNFVTVQKSYIWSQCHAVSMMEGVHNSSPPNQRLNYLTSNGLSCWKSGGCGILITESHAKTATTPFTHAHHSEPVMQFMGSMAEATTDGSEQWFIPVSGGTGWRTTTRRGVRTASGTPPKEGAVLVYGPAYGNAENGWVMYEGGHDLNNTGPVTARVAAQRAFLNFCLLAGKAKSPFFVSFNIPSTIQGGQALPVSVNVTSGTPAYNYQWSASIPGGSFGNPNAASTYYLAPEVLTVTTATLTCVVTDQCGRKNFITRPITINPSPLPVTLLYFKSEVNSKNEVILSWSTAAEKNNDYFSIERSSDNLQFSETGRVKGSGTTSQTKVYFFTDKTPVPGKSYYRLKQTDFNGNHEYFPAVEVTINKNDKSPVITVYPNPFSSHLTVVFDSEEHTPCHVQMLGADGRIVLSKVVESDGGKEKVTLETADLPEGNYIVRVFDDKKSLGSTRAICRR